MKTLNIDEILVLKWKGLVSHQIKKIDLEAFEKLYDENPVEFDRLLGKANTIFDKQETLGVKTISIQDVSYPERFKSIGNEAPVLIHCLGNIDLLKEEKAVAIIGARAADKQGLDAAYRLGKEYAEQGYVIVSGLAAGCDTAAHEGCLSVGGKTIAIVGSGLDIIHPAENIELQRRILESGGLVLSEQLLKQKASPKTLVARNRLQAALSETVMLAQCPIKSGSLHTMRFARNYKKQCFAVEFAKKSDVNAGNFDLIEKQLAEPVKI